MARLISREERWDGKVTLVIEVSEQDLRFYPQYYGLASERRERQ